MILDKQRDAKIGPQTGQTEAGRSKIPVTLFVNKFNISTVAVTKSVKLEFTHYFRLIEVLSFSDSLAFSSLPLSILYILHADFLYIFILLIYRRLGFSFPFSHFPVPSQFSHPPDTYLFLLE